MKSLIFIRRRLLHLSLLMGACFLASCHHFTRRDVPAGEPSGQVLFTAKNANPNLTIYENAGGKPKRLQTFGLYYTLNSTLELTTRPGTHVYSIGMSGMGIAPKVVCQSEVQVLQDHVTQVEIIPRFLGSHTASNITTTRFDCTLQVHPPRPLPRR